MRVCNDACPATCTLCSPVNYEEMRARRDATVRRNNGGPGRPPWWVGLGWDPDLSGTLSISLPRPVRL